MKSDSFFLFGARGTGKSTLLGRLFPKDIALTVDLLEPETVSRLQQSPSALGEIVAASDKPWCLIDEVQKVPELLDVVHKIIEEKRVKFALTGSSARKLKRGAANMLGGRAIMYNLFPLTHLEMGEDFDLNTALSYGTLAKLSEFSSDQERAMFLRTYVELYLKEEVLIEQLIRSLPPFRRFLDISATNDTELINFSNIARDVRSDPKNIINYYNILEDTLLGFFLEPYHTSLRKRQKKASKFYWFDCGVRRALSGTVDQRVTPKSFEYGSLFESFLINEIRRLLVYSGKSFNLSFIRVDEKNEIDLVIERAGQPTVLIEIKSTTSVNENHMAGIKRFRGEIKNSESYLFSLDRLTRKVDGVTCIYWKDGLKEIGLLPTDRLEKSKDLSD